MLRKAMLLLCSPPCHLRDECVGGRWGCDSRSDYLFAMETCSSVGARATVKRLGRKGVKDSIRQAHVDGSNVYFVFCVSGCAAVDLETAGRADRPGHSFAW